MKRLLLLTGLLLLFATEILRVYFIMPFPGSQQANTIGLAYFIDRNRIILRIIGAALVAYPIFTWKGKKWLLGATAALYAVIFYFFNFRFEADKMFYQPQTKTFANARDNYIPLNKLVIGVVLNGEAKAYPIQIIGYHHQVRDTVGGTPVMVTYCTVCRTGRVYSPNIGGKSQDFRLVGMDHFNAMFEDVATKSWWQQATGECVAGPEKGQRLTEIPSTQSMLDDWLNQYPQSKILQRDSAFNKQYDALADYDMGTMNSGLEWRDLASWKAKSWVVGVIADNKARAYDWNDLIKAGHIQDNLGTTPLLLVGFPDSTEFRVWNRKLDGQTLNFAEDTLTSVDYYTGKIIRGPFQGRQLQPLRAYQEFWHSWSHFHPGTDRYQSHATTSHSSTASR